jgi:hypothetical protein
MACGRSAHCARQRRGYRGISISRGNTTIILRTPPSFHIERLRKAPLGYFFDVMTNGFGVMPDYTSQIAPRDRWCIVAYIRALQLSQNATPADVAAGEKMPTPPLKFKEPGSGATPATPLPKSSYTGGEQTGEEQK